ncbi:alpha/beta fold hydrolase [Enterococcus rivorum]|uniref:Alpha/beta hydrolase n=1 Tax=Enterococcus rivorum TaxID=762845 RepID=A0A1E5KT85_9ENTE|nr:alpha/beta hydrolase [Enterococcus rivorum]MBP2098126.1 pimeloyl-ACP methyl ester carboxylesterase [Enterococcus rivorum]OEH81063.1 alpha/beta hydrolase [Enterococcus rivorum]
MKTEQKTLEMKDGSSIYYEVTGTGRPLFLLHGDSGSGDFYAQHVPTLKKYFTVYTVDSRDHGLSTNNSDTLTFKQMAEDLFNIMEKEEVNNASILGFSDGADLAVVFAVNYPKKVDYLILNAVNTEFSAIYFPVRVVINLNYMFTKMFSSFSRRMKKRLLITQLMRKNIGVTPRDLEEIKSKTLVIVGKQDIIKLSHSIYLVQKMPNASFVIVPKQGHSFACKDSKLFNQEILSFLLGEEIVL